MQRLHFAHRSIDLFGRPGGQRGVIPVQAAHCFRSRDATIALARRFRCDDTTVAARKRLENAPRAGEPLPQCVLRHAAEVRCLSLGQIEDVREHECEPMVAIEAGQHGQRASTLDLFDEHRVGLRLRGQAVEEIRAEAIECQRQCLHAAALPIEQMADGDAVRPRANRRLAAERGEPRHDLDENFLCDIFRVLGVRGHA
jgi:hypothetical protein